MRFALLTVGTRGDTQPYVALASELMQRGHDVVIAAAEDLAGFIEKAGIEVVPYKGLRMSELFGSPEGKAMLARGHLGRFLRWMGAQQARTEDAALEGVLEASEGADVLVSHPLVEVSTREFARSRRIPHVRTQLAPVIPTRFFPSPLLNVGAMRCEALRHWSHQLAMSAIWRAERPAYLRGCRRLGFVPAKRNPHVLLEEERVPCAHLVSPTLLPRPSDWAPHHVMTGHCDLPASVRERIGEGSHDASLERWLRDGPPPIYFGFGSMPILDPLAFMRIVREVLEALGLRGLVQAGWTRMPEFAGDDRLFIAQALNHDEILPRCRAAVHHGGLGTTTATLAAGLPTLICSVMLDQPFWGARVQELGAGEWMPFPRLTATRLREALERLLADPIKARAEALGARIREERGLQHTADFLEQHAAIRIAA